MPRLIDYGARYEFIREAVLRVCVRDGGRALSAASVAAEMNISVATLRRTLALTDALPALGTGYIQRLRSVREAMNRGKVSFTPVQLAQHVLERELPLDEERLHEERAWAEIVHTFRDDWVRRHLERHERYLDSLMADVVQRLEVPDEVGSRETVRLRALHAGLTSGLCGDRIGADEACAVLQAHVAELAGLRQAVPEPQPPESA